ncbi:hypothetical protein [Thalassoglobus polymorphus]|uniref:Uncharacterized protein n=1 Tax=Thalassoglobus polymorphus TaxID=2527994 RepID=A0A517QRL5_9PLAN|nr:hypothetical protein [Thalassoglobus polymorphus]QDT34255.1 hypothetical protein Mal48_35150 [Thalassoglobus polymorphus]
MINSDAEYAAILEGIFDEVKRLAKLTESKTPNGFDIINSHKKLSLLHDDAFQYQCTRLFETSVAKDDDAEAKRK